MEEQKMTDFRWPFAKWRQLWIKNADAIREEASEAAKKALGLEDAKHKRLLCKAARLSSNAASLYRKAGLGLAARECYAASVSFARDAGKERLAAGYADSRDSIEVYFEGEDT